MNKIPVSHTIGRAYGFTFGNLATIVGLIWLPTLAQTALQYYVTQRYLNSYLSAFAQGNLYELNSANGLRYLSIAVALFLQAILVTPVMRQALGLRSGGAFVSFAIGLASLRVFGAMAALMLIIVAIEYIAIFGLAIVAVVVAVVAGTWVNVHDPATAIALAFAVVALFIVFAGGMLFISLRLSFLVVPIAVAEKKIDLIRAWRLTHGNFWRIFVIGLAIGLPLAVAYLVLAWAALGFLLLHFPSQAMMAGWKGAPTKLLSWFIHAYLDRLPYLFGVNLLLAPFSTGLSTGAVAAAYRALVPSLENSGPVFASVPETSAA